MHNFLHPAQPTVNLCSINFQPACILLDVITNNYCLRRPEQSMVCKTPLCLFSLIHQSALTWRLHGNYFLFTR
jgi:hypothetical protein